jgi:hypothetical protein
MNIKILLLITFLLLPISTKAVTNNYQIAHTRYKNSNMVIVVINKSFFNGSNADQARWFTSIEQCVRSANLAGQTVVVANDNNRFRYYAPKTWHGFLRTIDMNWVRARLNKRLTCSF